MIIVRPIFDRQTPIKSMLTVVKAIKNYSRFVTTVTMSKTQDSLTCNKCGREVSLERNRYNRLFASCECSRQSIKVARKTPDEWG